ncbi:MAG: Uma2 family endonuclease [Leptolyngbyaceae cyanobacterium]
MMPSSTELASLGVTLPPTQAELPYDDGEPMESQRHQLQMELLMDGLGSWLEAREDGFVGGNMFVYYSLAQVRNRDFKGPDVFVALGVPKGERRSWVCWEEDKTPDVVIELLSESTATVDKGEKKRIYQDRMHVPEYFWYDPFNPDDWAGFQLRGGTYQEIPVDEQNRRVSEMLGLSLVPVAATYKDITATWLRWAALEGTLLLPTAAERAEQDKAVQIAQNLLAMGMDNTAIAQATGLTPTQVELLQERSDTNQ